MALKRNILDLRKRKQTIEKGGGEKAIQKQVSMGKLTARERILSILDEGSFNEYDMFVEHQARDFDMDKKVLHGDGVITGTGTIFGRPVCIYAQDFTVAGGSLGLMHARKITKMMDHALKLRVPLIGINDSGGARIQEGVNSLAGYGEIFFRNTLASGVIPQLSVILGPCAGGAVKELLSFIPWNNNERARSYPSKKPKRGYKIESIVPSDPTQPYDVRDVIKALVDESYFFEVMEKFAPNIRYCDAFNIPIVTLEDMPGYLPGVDQEHMGVIRHGAKILYAYSEATVPKITVVLRKAYGGGYIAMNSRHLRADFMFSWPTAEIAVMGPEGAANIIFRKEIMNAEDPEEMRKLKVKEYKEKFANPYVAAAQGYIDSVYLKVRAWVFQRKNTDYLHFKNSWLWIKKKKYAIRA